mgnify:CR=1 FL=1
MQIVRDGEKMTISFDTAPKFLYINETGIGCGKTFIDGVQLKGIKDIVIHAKTKTAKEDPFLEVITKQTLIKRNNVE